MRNYLFFAVFALLAVLANASQFHCECIIETPEGPKSCCPPETSTTPVPVKTTKTTTASTTLITKTIGPVCDCIVLTPTGPKSCCPPITVTETGTKTTSTKSKPTTKTTKKKTTTTTTKTTSTTKHFSATCDCIRLTQTGPVSCCGGPGPVIIDPTPKVTAL